VIKNTKQILADSLCELARTKPLEKITISDIVKNCGAGRQTFYYHFKDKSGLIGWVYENNADRVLNIMNSNNNLESKICDIYRHFVDNKQFYIKAIKVDNQNCFSSTLFEHSCNYYKKFIAERFGEKYLTEDLLFTIQFNCYGAVNMCRAWMLGGMKMPVDKFAEKLMENMPKNLVRYFN